MWGSHKPVSVFWLLGEKGIQYAWSVLLRMALFKSTQEENNCRRLAKPIDTAGKAWTIFWTQMTAAAVQWVLLSCYSSYSRMSWKPRPSLHWLYKLTGHVSRNEVLLCWFLTSIFFLLFVDVFAVCFVVMPTLLLCSIAQIPSILVEWNVLWVEWEMAMWINALSIHM